jgi:hypothetical protein
MKTAFPVQQHSTFIAINAMISALKVHMASMDYALNVISLVECVLERDKINV